MQLTTCSFSEFRPDMGQGVRISLGFPRFQRSFPWPNDAIRALMPRREYFRAEHDEFARRYIAQLDGFGVDYIRDLLERVQDGTGRPLVLLCFEQNVRSREDCHRRRFADWWLEHTGEFVEEVGGKGIRQDPTPDAPVLEPEPLFWLF